MPKRNCVVLNCKRETPLLHAFPSLQDRGRFLKWVACCGNISMLHRKPSVIQRVSKICHGHFTALDVIGKRVGRHAVPTINLPAPIVVPEDWFSERGDFRPQLTSDCVDDIVVPEAWFLKKHFRPQLASHCVDDIGLEDFSTVTVLSDSSTPEYPTETLSEDEITTSAAFDLPISDKPSNLVHTAKACQFSKIVKKEKQIIARRIRNLSLAPFQKQLMYLKRHLNSSKKRSFKQQLKCCEAVIAHYNKLPSHVQCFLRCKLKNISRNSITRRYSMEYKILALALQKRNPREYRLFASHFQLPSPRLLINLLKMVPVESGVLKDVLHCMGRCAANMSQNEKMCILLFGQMSLQPHLNYNSSKDCVEGFEDYGHTRTAQVADHMQVFMLKGISKKWKQTVAYNFCKGSASAAEIVKLYKEVVLCAQDIGLKIVASICDHGATNVSAVRILMEEAKADALRKGKVPVENVICIGATTVAHLYDPPHLFKSIRNNLLKRNLEFMDEGGIRVAKWSHIVQAYEIDSYRGCLQLMPKLTELHVVPSKIKKSKILLCTQVFSRSVAIGVDVFSTMGNCTAALNGGKDTATLCIFLNQLFDSFNRSIIQKAGVGSLRFFKMAMYQRQKFWIRAKRIIATMQFDAQRSERSKPAVLGHLLTTIAAFQRLVKYLRIVNPRKFHSGSFNQDVLQHYFGQLRQLGCRNIKSTCGSVTLGIKSKLIGVAGKCSENFYCKSDMCAPLLKNMSHLLQINHQRTVEPDLSITVQQSNYIIPASEAENFTFAYIAGWIASNKSKLMECEICAANVLSKHNKELDVQELLKAKERDPFSSVLKYCNKPFVDSLLKIYNICRFLLPQILHEKNVFLKIKSFIKANFHSPFQNCPHRYTLEDTVHDSFVLLLVRTYVKNLNNIILGRRHTVKYPDPLEKKLLNCYSNLK